MSDYIDPAKLDRLAEVAVRTGVNLQPGQDLVITAPPGDTAIPSNRDLTKHARESVDIFLAAYSSASPL